MPVRRTDVANSTYHYDQQLDHHGRAHNERGKGDDDDDGVRNRD